MQTYFSKKYNFFGDKTLIPFFKAVKVNLSEVLTNKVISYLYESLINIQHGEMIALSHSKLPALPRLTPQEHTQQPKLYWYKSIQMIEALKK